MSSNNTLLIVGAGGHAKVCAEIALLNGYEDIIFFDDNTKLHLKDCFLGYIAGKVEDINKYDGDVFIAIGDSVVRGRLLNELRSKNRNIVSLIHPSAMVSEYASIGIGVVIMAGAVINPTAVIKTGSIINTCSSVDHDCVVYDNSHIAVGAHLCGGVVIGKNCWIGAGATVINNIEIIDNVTIGAGAIVIDSIYESGTYVGIPAKRLT